MMGIQTSFSRLGSSAQCTHALVFIEEGPLSPVPTSQPSQNLMALRLQASYLPWPLRLGGCWHNTEEKKEHLHTHLPWALLGATCGYKSRLQISHRGSQEWSGSTQRSSCVCQIFLLWMYPFTFEEKNFQVWWGKTVLLFGFFMRNLSCKIWRIRKV